MDANPSEAAAVSFFRNVDLLSLDAGNTIIFLDHARIAELVGKQGFHVTKDALIRSEGDAKLAQERGQLLDFDWSEKAAPGALGWGGMIGTTIARAGVPESRLPEVIGALWKEHVRWNLYSLVPEGTGAALDRVRARGVKVAVVSNSEGMLDKLFTDLGILQHFDTVVDSGKLGVEKPDPRIFVEAMQRCHATPARTVHLGDSIATDLRGAEAAGLRCALVDPFGHITGRALEVPRVTGIVEACHRILASRS